MLEIGDFMSQTDWVPSEFMDFLYPCRRECNKILGKDQMNKQIRKRKMCRNCPISAVYSDLSYCERGAEILEGLQKKEITFSLAKMK